MVRRSALTGRCNPRCCNGGRGRSVPSQANAADVQPFRHAACAPSTSYPRGCPPGLPPRLSFGHRAQSSGAAPLTTSPHSDALVFFGATGDLAYKMIFPALQALIHRGQLDVPAIGVAKAGCTLEQLQQPAKASLTEHGGG